MIRQDWFKRHVETLAAAIGRALGLKGKGDILGATAAIENAIQSTFGLNGKLALSLSLNDFLSLICRGEKPSPELLTTLADLFGAWQELLEAQGRAVEAAATAVRVQALRSLAASGAKPR